jgi:hypothetical protein
VLRVEVLAPPGTLSAHATRVLVLKASLAYSHTPTRFLPAGGGNVAGVALRCAPAIWLQYCHDTVTCLDIVRYDELLLQYATHAVYYPSPRRGCCLGGILWVWFMVDCSANGGSSLSVYICCSLYLPPLFLPATSLFSSPRLCAASYLYILLLLVWAGGAASVTPLPMIY